MFSILLETSPEGDTYLSWLLSGLGWTLILAISAWCFAFVMAILVAFARTSSSKAMAMAGRAFVEVFRNIPVLVQTFLWYFVIPDLLPRPAADWVKSMSPPWGSFWPALIALSLYTAARVAEQLRAGIEALPAGQAEAARALGFTRVQAFRWIVAPQALRIVMPALTSEVMSAYKNTSVALTIGLLELTAQAKQISEVTFQTFAAFGAATLTYISLALIAYQTMNLIDNFLRKSGGDAERHAP